MGRKIPRSAELAARRTVVVEWPNRRIRFHIGDYVRFEGWDAGYWSKAIFQIKHFDSAHETSYPDMAWCLPIRGFPEDASTEGLEMEDGLLPAAFEALIHVSPLIALALQADESSLKDQG
jgi:hypothetical protein